MAKSLVRTIGEGTLWTTGSTIILKVVGLATIFLTLHRLSVYEYGLVQLVLSVLPLFSIFLLPGMSNVVVADMGVAKGTGALGEMRRIFSQYFVLQATLAFCAWAIVFFGADIIANFYAGQASSLLKIISFSFLIAPFRSSIQVALRVHLQFFQLSLYTVVEECLKLALIGVFFFVFHISVPGVLLALIFAELFTVFIMAGSFLNVYRGFSHAPVSKKEPFWGLLYFHGKWSVFSSYLNSFGQNVRLWIIKFILGTEAVGIFSVAAGMLSHTSSFIPISGILAPIIPQFVAQKERFYRLVVKGIKYQLFGSVAVGVVAFFLFPVIIEMLFPNYAPSMPLFQAMLITLIPMSFGTVTSAFYALKAQKSLFYSMVMKTVLIVVLAPVFLYLFGLPGIAYEFFLTLSLFAIERLIVLKKLLPGLRVRMGDIISFDQDDRMLVARIETFLKLRKK